MEHTGIEGNEGKLIFRCVFKKWDVVLWTGSVWLRIVTVCVHL